MFALALVLVAAVWELYKVIGPQDGGTIFGWTILPRANDTAMPHVWEMFSRYAQPENRRVVDPRSRWSSCRGRGSRSGSRSPGSRSARSSG